MIQRKILGIGLIVGMLGGFLTVTGCGKVHVRKAVWSSDLHLYDKVYITDVKVYSEEESAKGNKDLLAKIEEWKTYARSEMESYVKNSRYQLLLTPPTEKDRVLLVKLDIKVTYGNKALRYWVGFGAGSGGVDSRLTVTDSRTGEKKFEVTGDSDLSVGAFGGNMEAVLKSNIKSLIEQYPKRPLAE
ncbi:MAG: DUF4410 domain-containing protein [Elusimicrobia bacterium]|nr:DUF4410 domain-containing protein [Elusimicrobiota bacterium]